MVTNSGVHWSGSYLFFRFRILRKCCFFAKNIMYFAKNIMNFAKISRISRKCTFRRHFIADFCTKSGFRKIFCENAKMKYILRKRMISRFCEFAQYFLRKKSMPRHRRSGTRIHDPRWSPRRRPTWSSVRASPLWTWNCLCSTHLQTR